MNEDNIQKFIHLYGNGKGKFSLSLIISEPKEWTKEMFSGTCADWQENTRMRAEWRLKRWGTTTEAMECDGEGLELQRILKGDLSFRTANTLPAKIFEKMAADGLVFEIDLIKECWESGYGKAKNEKFQYAFDSDLEDETI